MSMSLPWQICKTTFKPNEQKTQLKKQSIRDLNVWKKLSYNEERKVGLLVFGFTFLENPPIPCLQLQVFLPSVAVRVGRNFGLRWYLRPRAQLMMINFI